MKKIWKTAFVLFVFALTRQSVQAQWVTGGGNRQYLTGPTEGVRVGTTTTTPPSALTVNGNEMSTPTGEVFRTDAPDDDTWWRLFRGGTEYGTLFSEVANSHFTQNAPEGRMRWQAQGILRMEMSGTRTYTIGPFTGQVKSGGVLLSAEVEDFYANGGPGPFSALHLARANTNNAQTLGYRPWMQNGVTFTGNSDQAYVGQKYSLVNGTPDPDKTDMVVQWSNDYGQEDGPDHLSFRFTSTYNSGAVTGGASWEGLEGMRLLPVDLNTINVGIGDFVAVNDEPSERLDVLDGKVRVRDLPTDPASASTEFVTVNMTNGVLEHRPLGALPDNCEWSMSPTAPNNVYTAVGAPNGACPDASERVGIGTFGPTFKLDVRHNEANGSLPMPGGLNVVFTPDAAGNAFGIRAEVLAAAGSIPANNSGVYVSTKNATVENRGVHVVTEQTDIAAGRVRAGHFTSTVNGTSTPLESFGVYAETSEAGTASAVTAHGLYARAMYNRTSAYGVYGTAQSVFDANDPNRKAYGVFGLGKGGTTSYGVYGQADQNGATDIGVYGYANGTGAGTANFGVRGRAIGSNLNYSVYGQLASGGVTNWSGFFEGPISAAGMAFPSDQNLKTDIQDLQSPMELLMRLRPKSYNYRLDQFPQMGLPTGLRYGFIAQEVQEEFPQFVTASHQPAHRDTLGNVVSASVDYLALSTADIIPILVGAVQEQHTGNASQAAEMDELRQRVDQLEHLLAACCANPDRAMPQPGSDTVIPAFAGMTPGMEKLRIQPNPFNERTTVYYKLDNGGRTQLMANSADGKDLRVLHEATLEKGDYQYEWNTAALAPGMYYVTLLVDGQPVVKKAVKVAR